jgi:hypothetical protein
LFAEFTKCNHFLGRDRITHYTGVGDVVGDQFGQRFGDLVGQGVGDLVGGLDGAAVGDLLGEVVGDSLGGVVGDSLGEVVGDSLGEVVGDDGEVVGAGTPAGLTVFAAKTEFGRFTDKTTGATQAALITSRLVTLLSSCSTEPAAFSNSRTRCCNASSSGC